VAIVNALQLEAARLRGIPFPLLLRRYAKFEVDEPTQYCRFAADTLLYAVNLTFDLEHLQCIACDVVKLCTQFECNRAIRGKVIAISIFDQLILNMCHVFRSALG